MEEDTESFEQEEEQKKIEEQEEYKEENISPLEDKEEKNFRLQDFPPWDQ